MPFEINLSGRLLNLIKKGLDSLVSVLNFNSIALYTVTTDVNGEATITFDTPYPEDSTLIIDWMPSLIDTTGMTAEEMQEAFTPIVVYYTDLTNEILTLKTIKRDEVTAGDGIGGTVTVNSPTLIPYADVTLDVLVIEIAA